LRCAFLLRPSHSSAPRPLRSADPGKPAASLPTESLYRRLSPSWPRSSRPFLHAPPVKEIDGRRQESISLLLGAGLCREMGPVRGIDFVAACLIFPLHAQYCLWDGNWCCGLVLARGSRSRDQKEVLAGQRAEWRRQRAERERQRAILFQFLITFSSISLIPDLIFQIGKMSLLFLLESKPTRDVATVAWTVCDGKRTVGAKGKDVVVHQSQPELCSCIR